MKNILVLSVLLGTLMATGCTTVKQVVGQGDSGMHATHAMMDGKAPVASKNGVLVDAHNHMTLYTYDKDTMNKSNCGSVCLVAWPAFLAPNATNAEGGFSTIRRDDGTYQWTMNGKPLYFYANDTEVGDMNGAEKLDVWHVIKTAR